MVLFLMFFALTAFMYTIAEGDVGNSRKKEIFFFVLTYILGAITIFLGIIYFINDSLHLPNPYDFHW